MFFGLKTPVTISTTLDRTEVIERFRRSIKSPRLLFPLFGASGIVGRVGPDSCWFENGLLLQRDCRRLRLRYEDGLNGTILRGSFMYADFRLFSLSLFFLVGIVLSISSIGVAIANRDPGNRFPGLLFLFPFGVLAAGVLMIKFNLWRNRRREQELIEKLKEILLVPPSFPFLGGDPNPPGGIVIRPRHEVI